MAILRFENLGDPSLDWMGRAFAEVVATDLAGARATTVIRAQRIHSLDGSLGSRPVSDPGISSEREGAIAAGANLVGYGTCEIVGGRLHASLAIEDIQTRRITRNLAASGSPGDVIGVAARLAAAISSQAAAFPTHNEDALREYSQAMELADYAQTVPLLEQAIAADPNFAPPYRILSQLQMQHQDRAASIATLEKALARGDSVSPAERARLAADLAGLQNEPQLRLRALSALVKLDPGDIGAWQTLAALAINRRQFAQSVAAYRVLLEREPDDFNSWNSLAYAAAYGGDYPAALDAIRHYAALRPNDLNPIDSLGDIDLLCGRFHDAEAAYLRAAQKDPNFRNNGEFFKAAMARLWTGDIAGANSLAGRYHQARAAAHDPLLGMRQIEWIWLTGRRKEACRQMQAYARGLLSDAAPRAWAELAIWDLMLGDRSGAQAAARGVGSASGMGMVIGFLLQAPAPAGEWTARAAQAFPNPQQAGLRNVALAAALLLGSEYQPAQEVLQRTVDSAAPEPDETARVLLAWADMESGRASEAASFLKSFPVPSFSGPDAFLSFSFPRFYYLRGEEAAKSGKSNEARADYRLFVQLSGPDPLLWGEEAKARAGL